MLKIKLFLCALLFLSACQTESNPLPIPTVEPSVNAENARVNMQVLVLDADANPLSGAEVVLKSTDDEQKASTATSGMTSFLDLSRSKTYQIEVSALGFKATSRSVHLESLTEAEQKDLIVSLKLEPAGKVILGKVIANGAPLEEVVVFDGSMSTTTNSEGEFSLAYAETPPTQLSFKRQGYQKQTQVVSTNGGQVDLGVVSLSSDPSARQAILDLRHSSLGLDGILSQAKMARLMQNIRDQGYQLQVLTEPSDSPLTGDLLILPSPSLALSVEEISAIQAYVIQGGKLLFTGEWEGFGGFNSETSNQLLGAFGFSIGQDALKEKGESALLLGNVSPHYTTRGIDALKLYQSASVVLSGKQNGGYLVQTSADGFRIASDNVKAHGTAVFGLYGLGKVVVLGDTSLWLDADSDGNGIANIDEAKNALFLKQILNW